MNTDIDVIRSQVSIVEKGRQKYGKGKQEKTFDNEAGLEESFIYINYIYIYLYFSFKEG